MLCGFSSGGWENGKYRERERKRVCLVQEVEKPASEMLYGFPTYKRDNLLLFLSHPLWKQTERQMKTFYFNLFVIFIETQTLKSSFTS